MTNDTQRDLTVGERGEKKDLIHVHSTNGERQNPVTFCTFCGHGIYAIEEQRLGMVSRRLGKIRKSPPTQLKILGGRQPELCSKGIFESEGPVVLKQDTSTPRVSLGRHVRRRSMIESIISGER